MEQLSLNHIALPARDPQKLVQWYTQKLGFVQKGKQLWSQGTALTLLQGTPLPNDDWHFGFRLSNHQALSTWRNKLVAAGVELSKEYAHGTYQSFFVRDPEGNDIEFFVETQDEPG